MLRAKIIGTFVGTALLFVSLWLWPNSVIAQPIPFTSSNPSARLFDNTIIVKYKELALHSKHPVQRKAKMDEIAAAHLAQHGVMVIRTLPILGIQQFRLGPGQLDTVILAIRKHPLVQYAEYNFRVIASEDPPPPPYLNPPDDGSWVHGLLWGLTRISMSNAWVYSRDASNIVVAVIDSGIDYEHPDLTQNMWTDPVTQSHGINSCVDTGTPMAGNPMDFNGHGTMVAGIIGAKGNNGPLGVLTDIRRGVGVSWEVQLIAAKFLCGGGPGETPYGSIFDAEAAIEYAIEKHADIINNSWRVFPGVPESEILTLLDAVRKTNCEGEPPGCKRALFVAAAGNGIQGESLNSDDSNCPVINPGDKCGKVYPANFAVSNIIAVAATKDWDDNLWDNSHYGLNSVPIAAPGVNIESTYLHGEGDGYAGMDGTSMAAPHVAGCAALLQAYSLASSGALRSIESLINKLLNSADFLGNLSEHITNGRRLNCERALVITPPLTDHHFICAACGQYEMLVQFMPGTDPSRIKALNDLLRVQVVRKLGVGQAILVRVPSDKSREEIRRAYSMYSEVESVGFGQ